MQCSYNLSSLSKPLKLRHCCDVQTMVSDPDAVLAKLETDFNDGKPIEVLTEGVREAIIKNVKRRMTPQPLKIRADVELTCFSYDGVLHIQVKCPQAHPHLGCQLRACIECWQEGYLGYGMSPAHYIEGSSHLNLAARIMAALCDAIGQLDTRSQSCSSRMPDKSREFWWPSTVTGNEQKLFCAVQHLSVEAGRASPYDVAFSILAATCCCEFLVQPLHNTCSVILGFCRYGGPAVVDRLSKRLSALFISAQMSVSSL